MIEFDSVGHTYAERPVLTDITARLPESRIGIIGSNGGGKSTLARTISGLVLPSSGQVRVAGFDTRKDRRRVRRRTGFVFTNPDHQIVMPTVGEDVAYSLRRSRLDAPARKQRVAETLERFGLADLAEQSAHQLSGGQKQLLALAAVSITEPEVLILDEPTTLLDLRNARRIRSMIRNLPQQVVVVSHDLELLGDFDRILVIEDGHLIDDGSPQATIDRYRQRAQP